MPAIHIRGVSDDDLAQLRAAAADQERSLNAYLLEVLRDRAERYRRRGEITEKLRRIAESVNLPAGAPMPEDLIRQDRDSR